MGKFKGYRNAISRFISSDKGQRFFNFAYSIGAAVVIWGALFKILHLPGGNTLLSIGMGTEVLMFVLTAFDRPPRTYNWENVFPVLDSNDPEDRPDFNGGGGVIINGGTGNSLWMPAYTAVTEDLYYAAGHLGTLKIPAIGLTVKVYQGTDSAALAKGAGHFSSTSIWNGNVAFAAHNRGVANHFGKIHTLSIGDKITYTTKLGTRTYEVYSVSKISVNDVSVLNDSADNILTLVTCVMNQPDYRWCVQAKAA